MTCTSLVCPRFSSSAMSGSARRPPPPAALVARAVVVAVVVIARPLGGVFVLVRGDQVRGVEEGALFRPDVDERGLDARQDGFDLAEVDVAHGAAGVGTIDQQLNKAVVLQNRHARLPRAAADEYLALQSNHLWPRSANSRAGRLVRSSKDWFRCGKRMRDGGPAGPAEPPADRHG